MCCEEGQRESDSCNPAGIKDSSKLTPATVPVLKTQKAKQISSIIYTTWCNSPVLTDLSSFLLPKGLLAWARSGSWTIPATAIAPGCVGRRWGSGPLSWAESQKQERVCFIHLFVAIATCLARPPGLTMVLPFHAIVVWNLSATSAARAAVEWESLKRWKRLWQPLPRY